MLSSFNLVAGESIADFKQSLAKFTEHMQNLDLAASCSPITQRCRHPVMDTDSERDQQYSFFMSFHDRAQCDRAVAYIEQQPQPADSIHRAVYAHIEDAIFSCWEELL